MLYVRCVRVTINRCRMGWGGCTVSLIPERIQSEFIQGLQKQYYTPRGITDDDNFDKYIFITGNPSPGASCIY